MAAITSAGSRASNVRRPVMTSCRSAPTQRYRCGDRLDHPESVLAPWTAACRQWRRLGSMAGCVRGTIVPRQAECCFCETKVQQLCARFREHDVAGLQVPVHDSMAMRVVKRICNVGGDSQCLRHGQGARWRRPASVSPSRHSITMKAEPSVLADVVDRADMWVRQLRNQSRLSVEPFPARRLARKSRCEQFHGDVATESVSRARYTSPIPPRPERVRSVGAETCTRRARAWTEGDSSVRPEARPEWRWTTWPSETQRCSGCVHCGISGVDKRLERVLATPCETENTHNARHQRAAISRCVFVSVPRVRGLIEESVGFSSKFTEGGGSKTVVGAREKWDRASPDFTYTYSLR